MACPTVKHESDDTLGLDRPAQPHSRQVEAGGV